MRLQLQGSKAGPTVYGSEGSRETARRANRDAAFPAHEVGAYRAGVRVEASLGALGVGHGARGEDERPPPRRGRRDGYPAAPPAVSRLSAEEAG